SFSDSPHRRDLHSFPTRRSSDLRAERNSRRGATAAPPRTVRLKTRSSSWCTSSLKRAVQKALPNRASRMFRSTLVTDNDKREPRAGRHEGICDNPQVLG